MFLQMRISKLRVATTRLEGFHGERDTQKDLVGRLSRLIARGLWC